MELSLIHAGLAAGAALAAVPVILHLFMKQTPKHIIFPALRLIRERQKRSRKKLRIKNWLLLLARMALVALMALALARPRLFSQTSLGDQEVPTALGLVFDTSLSMGYKDKDKTRLDEAKERAEEILKKTPDTSQVFVVDSAEPGVPVPLSPASARKRIEGLALRAVNRPLNAALGQAYAGVADSDRPRHEVYVLTDLARSAWDTGQPVEGLDKRKKVKTGIMTYVLRLVPKEVRDVAVVEAEPSASVASPGDPVEVRARLRSKGPATKRVVEFFLDGVPRGKETAELPANGEAVVKFRTPKLDAAKSMHQGEIRISGAPDPLAFDDVRFFTFKVMPASKVLLVSDRQADAIFVRDALDPDPGTLPAGTPRSFHVESFRTAQFESQPKAALKDYACVFLLNVEALSEDAWSRLNVYVRDGGGLVIGPGDRASAANYNGTAATQLVPVTLGTKHLKPETLFGKVSDFTHPLFNRYSRELDAVLTKVPVYRYWSITPSKNARTLLAFADNAPALLERTFKGPKTGRVLLWTTPLARNADRQAADAWNEFPNPEYWPFVAIMLNTVPYLAGTESEQLNYEAGRDVILPIDPTQRFKNYIVHSPDEKTTDRLTPPTSNDSLVIVTPQPVGQWKVTASNPEGGKLDLGFSVNPPLVETQLAPLETNDLNALFGGKEQYALADDTQSLARATELHRVGREIFPWLMALILIVVTAENLLANTFHRESDSQQQTPQSRPAPVGATT